MRTLRIAIVGFEGVDALDLVGVTSVLAKASSLSKALAIDLGSVSADGRTVATAFPKLMVTAPVGSEWLVGCDALVFPGGRAAVTATGRLDPQFRRAAQEAGSNGARLYSICSGAFILAACGLLVGRRVAIRRERRDELLKVCRCLPATGIVRDGPLVSIAGAPPSNYLKPLMMGFLILEEFDPDVISAVLETLELGDYRRIEASMESV